MNRKKILIATGHAEMQKIMLMPDALKDMGLEYIATLFGDFAKVFPMFHMYVVVDEQLLVAKAAEHSIVYTTIVE
jgi:hypothetical protein